MDRERLNWDWMQQHVPGVVAQLREWREAGEGAHLNECWRHGVVRLEPGWFFAREGAICLGVPWEPADELLRGWVKLAWQHTGLFLMLAPLPVGEGGPMGTRRVAARASMARGVGLGA